ncbi:MAG: DNA translocase FtsK [Bacillota bacterium]
MPRAKSTSKSAAVDETVLEKRSEILGVFILTLSILILLSLVLADPGVFGIVAREALWSAFGKIGAFFIPTALVYVGWILLWKRSGRSLVRKLLALLLTGLVFWVIIAFFENPASTREAVNSGFVGGSIYLLSVSLLSRIGTAVTLIAAAIIALILLIDQSLVALINSFSKKGRGYAGRMNTREKSASAFKTAPQYGSPATRREQNRIIRQLTESDKESAETTSKSASAGYWENVRQQPQMQTQRQMQETQMQPPKSHGAAKESGRSSKPGQQLPLNMPPGRYALPTLGLLDPTVARPRKPGKVAAQAKQLEETLASFGISARVIEIHSGPAITRYDLQPAAGVKVSKIVALADDLSLALAARGLRIEAPIPGKAAVGIEVPNNEIAVVTMREAFESPEFQNATGRLKVVLGKDIAGSAVVTELPKLPHLLVAGATGSGKSVCINTILASILFTSSPDQVKLVLIDPKRVELSSYNDIPHLLSPVVTEPKKAAAVLKCIVSEMENRYKIFAAAGARDIERYNASVAPEDILPSIVVVIDELADLMMVAPADVEDAICRLAQMARATGIHLVIATQRPSVDVITGLIKANIPSRIAFAVSSQIDSRTILDSAGAEKLLGRGDMLFAPVGMLKPLRVQGAYISDREIERLTTYWKNQGKPDYNENLVNAETQDRSVEGELDELFYDAVRVVIEAGQASASLLQRKLRIGYSRAGRLIDSMEERGLIGSADGSKAREVYITGRQLEEMINRGK